MFLQNVEFLKFLLIAELTVRLCEQRGEVAYPVRICAELRMGLIQKLT
jgi:hypothetical protein